MTITAKSTSGAHPRRSVTAAQPTSTGTAPAAPPITMFWRRGALEPERVDDDVEGGGRHGQHGRQQVDPRPQLGEGGHLEHHGEHRGGAGRDLAGDQGTVTGAVHDLVDVPVEDHVEGVGPARGERPAQRARGA